MFHIVCEKLGDSEGIPAKESEGTKKQILSPPTAYKTQIIVENFQKLKIKERKFRGTVCICVLKIPQLIEYLVNVRLCMPLKKGRKTKQTNRIYTLFSLLNIFQFITGLEASPIINKF